MQTIFTCRERVTQRGMTGITALLYLAAAFVFQSTDESSDCLLPSVLDRQLTLHTDAKKGGRVASLYCDGAARCAFGSHNLCELRGFGVKLHFTLVMHT